MIVSHSKTGKKSTKGTDVVMYDEIVLHLKSLFEKQDPKYADVVMYDSDDNRLYLHKIILLSNSYFESYFDFEDKKGNKIVGVQPLYDIKVQSVKHARHLIGTLYGVEIKMDDLDLRDLAGLIELAEFWAMGSIIKNEICPYILHKYSSSGSSYSTINPSDLCYILYIFTLQCKKTPHYHEIMSILVYFLNEYCSRNIMHKLEIDKIPPECFSYMKPMTIIRCIFSTNSYHLLDTYLKYPNGYYIFGINVGYPSGRVVKIEHSTLSDRLLLGKFFGNCGAPTDFLYFFNSKHPCLCYVESENEDVMKYIDRVAFYNCEHLLRLDGEIAVITKFMPFMAVTFKTIGYATYFSCRKKILTIKSSSILPDRNLNLFLVATPYSIDGKYLDYIDVTRKYNGLDKTYRIIDIKCVGNDGIFNTYKISLRGNRTKICIGEKISIVRVFNAS
jgi:hypothetical protein